MAVGVNRFLRKPATRGLEPSGEVWQLLDMRKGVKARPPMVSHQWIDLVDLAMHRAIVRKIRRQPALCNRARRTLARWERVKHACPPPLREWKQILKEKDMETVFRILKHQNDEGDRLRSTSPFRGILNQREVEAVWARYDKERI